MCKWVICWQSFLNIKVCKLGQLCFLSLCTAEVDYSPDPQSLSFTINCAPIMDTSGGDTLCVEVNIIDDGLVEGPETFRLILNTDELSVPEVDSTTVTINDNDGKLAGVESVYWVKVTHKDIITLFPLTTSESFECWEKN